MTEINLDMYASQALKEDIEKLISSKATPEMLENYRFKWMRILDDAELRKALRTFLTTGSVTTANDAVAERLMDLGRTVKHDKETDTYTIS